MKLAEAEAIIKEARAEANRRARGGYRVHFERRERGILVSDYFPDPNEEPIDTEEEAWSLAKDFAAGDPHSSRFVNIYVIKASDWCPVDGYDARTLNRYPMVFAANETYDHPRQADALRGR